VPGVIGKSLEEAKAVFDEKKLILDKIITVPSSKTGKIIAQMPTEGTEILQDSKVTLIIGGEQKAYFFMPDTRKMDITELAEEMELKKIKYKINYARDEHGPYGSGFSISVPARTIFKSSDEVVINIY